ncbi:PREDICTED: glutathione S-transferase T2-like [Brassica oleracea var. oleracea]|uniref:glutathione S-transferase T2-like n=1 Tax=Brassica oleracea var. oleracea TaxID=109376 RepID=UPI0006A74E6A|nr:PREDICTED: glutathione S-transferase T2-like [Brassica oleracea var. oleracea]
MDSRNPYSQRSSYVALLNSQQENFRYGNFPSTVNFGASEIPPFSSQQSEAPAQPEATPVERRERRKWTPSDDEVLISAWLNTSKDAVVGNDQKTGTFWKRVGEYFPTSPYGRELCLKGEHLHCKQRWQKINDLTNKLCAAYAAAERQNCSVQNDNDVLKVSHDIFYSDHNLKFNVEHAWCVLRYEQKWINLNTPKASGSSKRKCGEGGSQSSSTTVGDHEIRPEGIKAAKARRNNAQGKALSDYKSMWELKMEDLAMKEKLSKLAILDTLLAKKKPLSETEEASYSYTQPSESEQYGLGSADSGYSQTEADILLYQAEISYNNAQRLQYPPQPEVKFGFPKTCYCGADPLVATSYTRNDPDRRYYTCENADDGECHVWKWWDVAVMEEMRAMQTQTGQLAEKVDFLTFLSDYETQLTHFKELHNDTEQKLVRLEQIVRDLAKKKSRFTHGFEFVVGVVVIVFVLIGLVLIFK